jgi:predicted GNAT family acetyltransferase
VITVDDVREVASKLPRSYEALVRDRIKFRVGRIVYLAFSRDETVMGFAFPKEERDALVASEPGKFLMPRASELRYNWVQVRLDALDQSEMRELVVDAWRMVVPKTVAATVSVPAGRDIQERDATRNRPPASSVGFAMEGVVDNPARARFELTRDGHTAELIYSVAGDRLVLRHTEVPKALGGQGIGGELVLAAVRRAEREGLTVVPSCPYARRWIEKHPDRVGDVAIDRNARR